MNREITVSILLSTYFLYYSTRNLLTSASAYFISRDIITRDAFAIAQTTAYLAIFPAKLLSGFFVRVLKTFNARLGFFTALPCSNLILLLVLAAVGMCSQNVKGLQITFIMVYCICKFLTSFARVILLHIFQKSLLKDRSGNSGELAAFSTAIQVISALGDAAGKLSFGTLLKRYATWELPLTIMAAISGIGVLSNLTLFKWSRSARTEFRFLPTNIEKSIPFTWRGLCTSKFILCAIICMMDSLIGVALGAYSTHLLKFGFGIDAAEATRLDALPPLILLIGVAMGGYLMRRMRNSPYRVLNVLLIPYAVFNIGLTCGVYWNLTYKGSSVLSLALLFAQNAAFYWTRNQIDGSYLMLIVPPEHAAIATGVISGVGYLFSLIVPYVIKDYSLSYEGWRMILQAVIVIEILTLIPLTILSFADFYRK